MENPTCHQGDTSMQLWKAVSSLRFKLKKLVVSKAQNGLAHLSLCTWVHLEQFDYLT